MYKMEKRNTVIALLALILSILNSGYTLYIDIIDAKEDISIIFDKVAPKDSIILEKELAPAGGEIVYIPINCRVIVSNNSSKPVSILDLRYSEEELKEVEELESKELYTMENIEKLDKLMKKYQFGERTGNSTPQLEKIFIDGKEIEYKNKQLTKAIKINPKESKILTFNMSYPLTKKISSKVLEEFKVGENIDLSNFTSFLFMNGFCIYGEYKGGIIDLDVMEKEKENVPRFTLWLDTSKGNIFSKSGVFDSYSYGRYN